MGDEDLPTVEIYLDSVELTTLERGMILVLREHGEYCRDCEAKKRGWSSEPCGEYVWLNGLTRRIIRRRKAVEGVTQ